MKKGTPPDRSRAILILPASLLLLLGSGAAAADRSFPPQIEFIMKGNTIKIGVDIDGNMYMGRSGSYRVRPASLVPRKYTKIEIPAGDVPKFKKAFDKALRWFEINRQHNKNVSKLVFKTRWITLKFSGSQDGEDRLFIQLDTDDRSAWDRDGDAQEGFEETDVRSISHRLSQANIDKIKSKLRTKAERDASAKARTAQQKREQRAEVDRLFK